MKVERRKNEDGCYDYEIKEGKDKLWIWYGGNLDLYLTLFVDDLLEPTGEQHRDFFITKENYQIFRLFDNLYKEVINGQVFLPDEEDEIEGPSFLKREDTTDYKDTYQYKLLVNNANQIVWISDEDPMEYGDSLTISPEDEDSYRLRFTRYPDFDQTKTGYAVGVRIRTSGSRYDYFHIPFMRMFQNLQFIDPDYHQVDMEEVLYQQKTKQKKRTN